MSAPGRWKVVTVAALVTAVLVAFSNLGPIGETIASPSVGPSSIYVANTADYVYAPDTFENLPTYTNITVTFVMNVSEYDTHTFTIIGEEGVQLPLDTSQQEIDELSFGHSPAPLFNLNVSYPDDIRSVGSFESPGPGWYEFLCSQWGHFANGMYGFIAFGMSLPTNLTLPQVRTSIGANLNFNATEAVVVGALVAVAAVGYVMLRRLQSRAREEREEADRKS